MTDLNGKASRMQVDDVITDENDKAHRITIIHGDFLELNYSDRYDLILMNPPFKRGKWRRFIAEALELLAPNGRLITIYPAHITSSGYVEKVLEDDFPFEGGSAPNGRLVIIKQGARNDQLSRVIGQEEDPELNIKGIRMLKGIKGGTTPKKLDKDTIVFSVYKKPEDFDNWKTRMREIPAEGGWWTPFQSDGSKIGNENFKKLIHCLDTGGLEHIKQQFDIRRTEYMNTKKVRLAFTRGEWYKWINEAWRLYGPKTEV